jgi:hypothetical protein
MRALHQLLPQTRPASAQDAGRRPKVGWRLPDTGANGLTAMESPTLIDVWTVDSSRRAQLVQLILEILREVVTKRPGFISARVYESTDGGAAMVGIDMRTVEERHDLTDSREIHTAVRGLRAIAHFHVRLYLLVENIGEPGAA